MISYEEFIKEVMSKIPKIEKNMKFEVLKSIYPDETINRNLKNLNEGFTMPLALSTKDKIKIRKKEDNILNDFLNFKKIKKESGDILIVKEINNNIALCENISRNKEITDKYFNKEELKYIKISSKDILEGTVKIVKRIRS
jgi:hypothetical protein